jgi:hypothetical protein
MCLLKRDEQDTNCGHEECKNYYMLNKQICMYNLATSQKSLNGSNPLLNAQTQINSLASQPTTKNSNPSQLLQAKKSRNHPVQTNTLEQENSSLIQKKKIKTEEDPKDSDSNQLLLEASSQLPELLFSNAFGQANGNRELFNTSLLNNLLASSAPQQKNDMSGLSGQALLLPFMQNTQSSQNPTNSLLTNQISQLLSQNLKVKPGNNSSQAEIKTKTETNSSSTEVFLKEFQTRILGLLFSQNKMLMELKEKNEVLQDTLACLINEITSLKSAIKQTSQEKGGTAQSNPLIMHQIIGNSAETVTVENLLTYLYGSNPDFPYQLVLKSDLQLPLYRERNFKFTVILTDKNGNPIENSNRIPLTIGIYSSENPPKYIDSNTAGNKILKGFIEKDLINGTASFEKIQVKEVTSHFRNGWIFFVVYPKVSNNPNNNILLGGNGAVINGQKIKPLILEKVIVKAKKAKEKDDRDDNGTVQDDRDDLNKDEVVY